MADILKNLEELRKETNQLKAFEKDSNDHPDKPHLWSVSYGEKNVAYEQDFGRLISEPNLRIHLKKRAAESRQDGIPFVVLDLFSPISSFLNGIQKRNEDDDNLTIDGGIASTLNDPRRDPKKIESDRKKNLFCIEGDITMAQPRKELRELMQKLGIEDIGFKAVFARPYGGAFIQQGEEKNIAIYYSLLRQIWKITSKLEGEIFCPIPAHFRDDSPTFNKWLTIMRNDVKADVEVSPRGSNMKIIKHPDSKSKLPGFKDLLAED